MFELTPAYMTNYGMYFIPSEAIFIKLNSQLSEEWKSLSKQITIAIDQ